jgi:hypothetical protein
MNAAKGFFCAVMVLSIGIGLALAQDVENTGVVGQELKESDVQWVWGEAVSIDVDKSVFVVKYLDYEDNQEKMLTVNVDAGTVYESIKSLGEVKPQDFLSIDYMVTQDGKNIAKNISLDKPKELESAVQPQVEAGVRAGLEMKAEPVEPLQLATEIETEPENKVAPEVKAEPVAQPQAEAGESEPVIAQ